jgi:hypothetical protein
MLRRIDQIRRLYRIFCKCTDESVKERELTVISQELRELALKKPVMYYNKNELKKQFSLLFEHEKISEIVKPNRKRKIGKKVLKNCLYALKTHGLKPLKTADRILAKELLWSITDGISLETDSIMNCERYRLFIKESSRHARKNPDMYAGDNNPIIKAIRAKSFNTNSNQLPRSYVPPKFSLESISNPPPPKRPYFLDLIEHLLHVYTVVPFDKELSAKLYQISNKHYKKLIRHYSINVNMIGLENFCEIDFKSAKEKDIIESREFYSVEALITIAIEEDIRPSNNEKIWLRLFGWLIKPISIKNIKLHQIPERHRFFCNILSHSGKRKINNFDDMFAQMLTTLLNLLSDENVKIEEPAIKFFTKFLLSDSQHFRKKLERLRKLKLGASIIPGPLKPVTAYLKPTPTMNKYLAIKGRYYNQFYPGSTSALIFPKILYKLSLFHEAFFYSIPGECIIDRSGNYEESGDINFIKSHIKSCDPTADFSLDGFYNQLFRIYFKSDIKPITVDDYSNCAGLFYYELIFSYYRYITEGFCFARFEADVIWGDVKTSMKKEMIYFIKNNIHYRDTISLTYLDSVVSRFAESPAFEKMKTLERLPSSFGNLKLPTKVINFVRRKQCVDSPCMYCGGNNPMHDNNNMVVEKIEKLEPAAPLNIVVKNRTKLLDISYPELKFEHETMQKMITENDHGADTLKCEILFKIRKYVRHNIFYMKRNRDCKGELLSKTCILTKSLALKSGFRSVTVEDSTIKNWEEKAEQERSREYARHMKSLEERHEALKLKAQNSKMSRGSDKTSIG